MCPSDPGFQKFINVTATIIMIFFLWSGDFILYDNVFKAIESNKQLDVAKKSQNKTWTNLKENTCSSSFTKARSVFALMRWITLPFGKKIIDSTGNS